MPFELLAGFQSKSAWTILMMIKELTFVYISCVSMKYFTLTIEHTIFKTSLIYHILDGELKPALSI